MQNKFSNFGYMYLASYTWQCECKQTFYPNCLRKSKMPHAWQDYCQKVLQIAFASGSINTCYF